VSLTRVVYSLAVHFFISLSLGLQPVDACHTTAT
jgi:hypothetical protein